MSQGDSVQPNTEKNAQKSGTVMWRGGIPGPAGAQQELEEPLTGSKAPPDSDPWHGSSFSCLPSPECLGTQGRAGVEHQTLDPPNADTSF
jgi:hypothetical protein